MGTNYYKESGTRERCPQCHTVLKEPERVHIGKSSMGWKFLFASVGDITSYREWLVLLNCPDVVIRDEYGETITLEDFKAMVQNKQDGRSHTYFELR